MRNQYGMPIKGWCRVNSGKLFLDSTYIHCGFMRSENIINLVLVILEVFFKSKKSDSNVLNLHLIWRSKQPISIQTPFPVQKSESLLSHLATQRSDKWDLLWFEAFSEEIVIGKRELYKKIILFSFKSTSNIGRKLAPIFVSSRNSWTIKLD